MAKRSREELPFGPHYADHPIAARVSKTCGVTWTVRGRERAKLNSSYFVDEAGDSALFAQGGRVLIGQEGCSRFFMLGLTWVLDPLELTRDLAALRADLVADTYFRRVPSMRPEAKKTALFFHAKDDVPEVRREVFKVLRRHPLQFFAAVRDKESLLASVRARNEREPSYRYQPNHAYDDLVTKLFRERLHRDGGYTVEFARRGKSDRTAALNEALRRGREQFYAKWGVASDAPVDVVPMNPVDSAGLQATDYLLWAIQRCYERNEDRYLEFAWPSIRLVHDLDDVSQQAYGRFYTQDVQLTAGDLAGRRRRI